MICQDKTLRRKYTRIQDMTAKWHRIGITLAIAATLCITALPASAELNLWISYHFAGTDNYKTGDYQEALILLQEALDETKTKHRKGNTHDMLGRVDTALGNFESAKDHYHMALKLKERDLGKKHRDIATTLNNIADLNYILGQTENIESLYRRALKINERDQLNLEITRSLNGLALLYHDNGEPVEAEEHLKRAIAIHEKAQRRDHPYLATVLTNLGILYTNQERYDEAAPLFDRAKYIQDTKLRDNHPDVAVRMHATAAMLYATGKTSESMQLAAQADAIRAEQKAKGDLY